MRKLTKRLVALFMAGTMIFSLAACGQDKDQGGKATDATTKEAGEAKDPGAIDTSKHVNVKLIVLGNKPTNGRIDAVLKEINTKLTEKVNAELELQYVEWADWQTQYNLLLASGDDTIDLITTATDWLDAWPNVKKGSFLPLTEDMLKTYAPKTWESVPQENWDQCKYKDEIYIVPEDNFAQYTNHGFYYRGDWAKEFGIESINDFETMGKYLQGIKDNKEDVIPWDVSGSAANGNAIAGGYMQSNTMNIGIDGIPIGLSALFYGKSKDDIYTLASPYMEGTTFEDFAVMMKSWADNGYWREDVLNYSGETRDLMYAGQTGTDQHHSMTYYTTVRPMMDEKQPGSEVQMFSFSEPSKNLSKIVITHGALAVGANSKNPERALMVYDLLRNDEEIYRLLNYGIEGTDYILTDDGKLDRPEGFDKTKDALDSNFWCGRTDTLELDDVTWYSGKDDIIKNYDSYAIDYPYGQFIIDNSNIETKVAAMAEVCNNYIPKIAFGKVDDPKAEVAAFRKDLMAAGYQEVYDDLQAQLTAFKATQE